jgi:hypothetical protein
MPKLFDDLSVDGQSYRYSGPASSTAPSLPPRPSTAQGGNFDFPQVMMKRVLLATAFAGALLTGAHGADITPYLCNGSLTVGTGKGIERVRNLQVVWSHADKVMRFDIPPFLPYLDGVKPYVVTVDDERTSTITLTGHEVAERPGDAPLEYAGTFDQVSNVLQLEVWARERIVELWTLVCRPKRVR